MEIEIVLIVGLLLVVAGLCWMSYCLGRLDQTKHDLKQRLNGIGKTSRQ